MNKALVRIAHATLRLAVVVVITLGTMWALGRIVATFVLGDPDLSTGDVPKTFMVAIEEPGKDGQRSFRIVFWEEALAVRASKADASFRLSATDWKDQGRRFVGFNILEQGPDFQLVEVRYWNSWGSKSRYRVEGREIVPLSYYHDGALLYVLYLAVGLLIGRSVANRLRKRLQAPP